MWRTSREINCRRNPATVQLILYKACRQPGTRAWNQNNWPSSLELSDQPRAAKVARQIAVFCCIMQSRLPSSSHALIISSHSNLSSANRRTSRDSDTTATLNIVLSWNGQTWWLTPFSTNKRNNLRSFPCTAKTIKVDPISTKVWMKRSQVWDETTPNAS